MSDLKSIVDKWQTFMYKNRGWNALYLENHDQARTISRWASDKPEFRTLAAKMFATFLCFQSGTVFVYQGQELVGADAAALDIARKEYQLKSRDHARLPVQWDSSPNAGFSTGTPWIRVNDDYKTCNAAAQVSATGSVFEYWRSTLALRKDLRSIFVYGDFELLDRSHEDVFAYSRSSGDQKAVVVCNFRETLVTWDVPPSVNLSSGKVLLSNYLEVDVTQDKLALRPFEALVVSVKKE
ncbi:hypothetical protein NW754_010244 [Fusarium falciforme]|nr:hypothetical protein NW754_010244 [Fusarium falciforme]